MTSSKGENPGNGPGPSMKKAKQERKFLSLLEDVLDKLDKSYCIQLPLLSTMAWKYLCILATSVPSKHAFSTAGNIANAKRSCLLPENTNILTFLAENLD